MPISIKPHNVEAYKKLVEKFKEVDRAAIVHPTGTGKMFIALKLLEENKGKRAIYVSPSNPILHDVKKNIFAEGMTMKDFPLLKRITYQKLKKLSDEEIEKIGADIIILDEFHHCGAPEWGKGVERLIERNPGAKILGLSATPLRYLDGMRDMSDELFDGNVVSEMSLEEAINRGILPEATYISSVYGLNSEVERLQEQINKMTNLEKKQQAQSLLEILREQLSEESADLSDLFSSYIQNPTGKYIVFCKNIEDMNEKMAQAQKMFSVVNPNIKVRGISSKIKESEKILTEFEQDSDEGTLKLLYAVNMINEGYHIKGLDGVIMMRPTFSPTIYTQQIGRALTVGGDKKPVVIDLVNNYDSCKIIEDFTERMKQYKGHEGSGNSEEPKSEEFSIFDKTKSFREVVEKIMILSARNVSLEEKIQVFERFAKTGEELDGNTIFEGYPIGQWAIQIRSVLKRQDRDVDNEQLTINPTEDQLDRLTKLGILERQIEATIDEKIDSLIDWRRKYPNATVARTVSEEVLNEYAKTEEDLKQLLEEYDKMLRYYDYVRTRKSQGKLNEEQIEKCRAGDIGGVFDSYPAEVEKNELMEKYGLDGQFIDLIRKQYGSIDKFRKVYIDALINQNVDKAIPKKILEDARLIRNFDLSSSDWIARSSGLELFIFDVFGNHKAFMKYEGLEESIIELTEKGGFTKQEQQVLFMYYGLNGEKGANQVQVARNIGKSNSRVGQILAKTLRLFRQRSRSKYLYGPDRAADIDFDIQKKVIAEYFNYFDIFVPDKPIQMDEDVKRKLTDTLLDAIEKTKRRNEQVGIIERMPNEQILDIVKAKFGEKISKSDISVVPYWHSVYGLFEETDYIDITERLVDPFWGRFSKIFYKECLDSEYTQSKIAEFMVNNLSNSELAEAGKKEEIKSIIDSNEYFSEERKKELNDLLDERLHTAVKEKIHEEIGALSLSISMEEASRLRIEELDLSVRSYNCLSRAGIRTVGDIIGKSEEEFMKTRNLGKKSYDEIIEKLQSLGMEIVDGYFKPSRNAEENGIKVQTVNTDESVIMNIENEINGSGVLRDDEKETLRTMLHDKYQEIKKQEISTEEEQLRSEVMNIIATISGEKLNEMQIKELDLSVRSFNCLLRAGIRTVGDIIGKSEEKLMKIRNLGKRSCDEVIEKLQSMGIEIVNGQVAYTKVTSDDDKLINKQVEMLEQKINNNQHLDEEKKKELRALLYEKFGVTRANSQEKAESTEEESKDEIVERILKKQKTIAEQIKEIDELSSPKKEETLE